MTLQIKINQSYYRISLGKEKVKDFIKHRTFVLIQIEPNQITGRL